MQIINTLAISGLLLCAAAQVLASQATQDNAATNNAPLQNPPQIQWQQNASSPHLLQSASAAEKVFSWRVDYSKNKLYNPMTGRYDKVKLRSYQGSNLDPDAPFVAPTLIVQPGDTLRAALDNRLPADPACINSDKSVNDPHCFNGTNMHTHGLWINPAGNSDNVLISINPGVKFEYEYNIPADHPAGTFWYHPHRHGSTAIQVSSGMAGALLIKGNRAPSLEHNGDLDTLLQNATERVMLFQQIQYYCSGDGSKAEDYLCAPRDIGKLESYAGFGPGGWAESGRHTSINGRIQPLIEAKMGDVERWRLIHAGVRDSINLSIRKANGPLLAVQQTTPQALAAGEQSEIDALCGGAVVPQELVAADGLTLPAMQSKTLTILQPGYRFDALTSFPEPGDYCVLDEAAPASANVDRVTSSRKLLAIVRVSGEGRIEPAQHIAAFLEESANVYPPEVTKKVTSDLKTRSLALFTPHANITDEELTPIPKARSHTQHAAHASSSTAEAQSAQTLSFNIANGLFMIDDEAFAPGRIDRHLTLGDVEQWELTSKLASHPFHIHVNPFEVLAVYDPNGKDVSLPDAVDDYDTSGPPDTQYAGLKGAFKDTLWVKAVRVKINEKESVTKSYRVLVRTRYQRYIGDFVLHCHILDHEDQGMMQNVRISLPNGQGGISHGHH